MREISLEQWLHAAIQQQRAGALLAHRKPQRPSRSTDTSPKTRISFVLMLGLCCAAMLLL